MLSINGEDWRKETVELATDLERVASLLRSTSTIHDPLTGLRSAEYLQERLREEISRSDRYRTPFSLVAVSLLGNTGLAAGVGDQAVQEIAKILRINVRDMDVAARVNRREFMLLLPEAGKLEAKAVAERLARLAERAGEGIGELRVVAGVSSFPEDGVDSASLQAAARLALLRARTGGLGGMARRSTVDAKAAVAGEGNPPGLVVLKEAADRKPKRASEQSPIEQGSSLQRPVAVGFVDGGQFPASYWEADEPVTVEAVLEQHQGENESWLLVQTAEGVVRLTQQGRRWYLGDA